VAADLIHAEGWQYVWLSLTLIVLWKASSAHPATYTAGWALLIGWFVSNLFWDIRPVYILSDLICALVMMGLWVQTRLPHLLTVATLYLSMLLLHWIDPPMPSYMVALNVLFGSQLLAVYYGAAAVPRNEV